jgi:4-amino-4-deoxy-L-arabinose transferase-like glycosyltransferase
LPLALAGLLAAALALRGVPRSDRRLAALLVMGGWLAVEAVVLSVSRGIVAPYYVSALGPGVAALIGAASWSVGELSRRGRLRLIVPAAGLLAALAVELLLAHREYAYLRWLWPLLVVAVAGSAALMLRSARHALLAWAVALPVLLVLPAAYSTSVWAVPVDGTFPAAGPYIPDNPDARSYGIPPDDVQSYRTLLRYVRSHQRGSRWDVLVQSSDTAAALILLGGRAAALGGYGTTDPVLTPAQLAHVVASGETRYVALGGGYASRGGNAASAAVAATCRELPPQRWRAPHNSGTPAHPRYAYPQGGWNLVLYDCAGRAAPLASA